MPAWHARVLEHSGDARRPFVAGLLEPECLRRVGGVGRARHRDRAGVRGVGQQRTQDDDGLHVELVGDRQQLGAEGAPAHVGLHAVHQHDVAVRAGRTAVRDPHRRPHQLPGHPVDLPDHRPVDLVVVVGLVVDLHDRLGFPDRVQVLERVAGRVAGVVPALEGRDDDRVVEFRQVGRLEAARIRRGHHASVSPGWRQGVASPHQLICVERRPCFCD